MLECSTYITGILSILCTVSLLKYLHACIVTHYKLAASTRASSNKGVGPKLRFLLLGGNTALLSYIWMIKKCFMCYSKIKALANLLKVHLYVPRLIKSLDNLDSIGIHPIFSVAKGSLEDERAWEQAYLTKMIEHGQDKIQPASAGRRKKVHYKLIFYMPKF